MFPICSSDTLLPAIEDYVKIPKVPTSDHQMEALSNTAVLVGVPRILFENKQDVYQVQQGQPHLLAFPIPRHQSCRLRITMTADRFTSRVKVISADPKVQIYSGSVHNEAIIHDDLKAPLYMIFRDLTAIHKLMIESSVILLDGSIQTLSHQLLVQNSTLAQDNQHTELITRFRFKCEFDIDFSIMFNSNSHNQTIETQLLNYLNKDPTRPQGHFDAFTFFCHNELHNWFHNKQDRPILASIAYLLEYIGTSRSAIRMILDLAKHHQTTNIPLTPAVAVAAFENYFKLDLSKTTIPALELLVHPTPPPSRINSPGSTDFTKRLRPPYYSRMIKSAKRSFHPLQARLTKSTDINLHISPPATPPLDTPRPSSPAMPCPTPTSDLESPFDRAFKAALEAQQAELPPSPENDSPSFNPTSLDTEPSSPQDE